MSPSSEKPGDPAQHAWENGWEDHKRQQMLRLARLSFPEKLAWLEEAHRLVRHLAEQRQTQAESDQK